MSLLLNDINKTYKSESGTIEVLRDINLDIKYSEFICIVGPSGCGKSTLVNIIAGLEKPNIGKVKYNMKEINSPGPDRAVIFQDAALFPWLKVIDNIELGMKIAGISKPERRKKAVYYLEMMHLAEFQNYYIHQLSGGMKQRVAIARALSLESEILLMDEPFASVDNQTRDILHYELLKIWNETKKTIIFITHNIDEAVLLADRIIIMGYRPSSIKKVINITAERPRNIDMMESGIINEIKRELQWCAEKGVSDKQSYKKDFVLPDIGSAMGSDL